MRYDKKGQIIIFSVLLNMDINILIKSFCDTPIFKDPVD